MMCLTYWNSFIFALQDEYRHGTYLRDCRNRENQSLPANCYHTKTDFIGPLIWESCQNENCNENSVAAACLAHQNILHSYPAVVLQTKYLPEKGGVSMFMQFMIFLWFPHTPNKEKGRRLPFFGPWTIPPIALPYCSESTGDVLVGQGGVDHPRGKGGGSEEGGGNEDGGGDEKGEESPMDGLIGWTRLGKKRRVS